MDYKQRLDALVEKSNSMSGTAGQRTLRKVILDLEGDGPIGDLLHSLDRELFMEVIELFLEFKRTGRRMAFNALHYDARNRLQ